MSKSVEKLALELIDNDETVRAAAADSIRELDIGPQHAAAVPTLIEALDQDDPKEASEAAAWALGWIGAPAKPAIEALAECLRRERNSIRGDALEFREALLNIARADHSATVEILGAIDLDDPDDADSFLEILYEKGPAAMAQAFTVGNQDHFYGTVIWLCGMDEETLATIYRDRDVQAGGIIDSNILTALRDLIRDSPTLWSRNHDKAATKVLIAALERDDKDIRERASDILSSMDYGCRQMVPEHLREYLRPEDE